MKKIILPQSPNDLLPFPQNVGAALTSRGASSDVCRYVFAALSKYLDLDAEPFEIELGSIGSLICDGPHNEVRLIKSSKTLEVCHIDINLVEEEIK